MGAPEESKDKTVNKPLDGTPKGTTIGMFDDSKSTTETSQDGTPKGSTIG